jgi:hypothetical protein
MSNQVGGLLEDKRLNAIISWILILLIAVAITVSVASGDLLWAGVAVFVIAIAVIPAVAKGSARAMLPWEVTALTAIPVLGRSLASVPVTNQVATYLSVAAMAFVVAVELHLFTSVRMTDAFAVSFVAVTTMAMAGTWAVVRWVLDSFLGTTFLLDPALTTAAIERALMWEFVASTAGGLLGGLLFAGYVRYLATSTATDRRGLAE